jgi:hypothetical protein
MFPYRSGDRGHAELLRSVDELPDADGAVQERVLRVDVKMHDLGGHRRHLSRSAVGDKACC